MAFEERLDVPPEQCVPRCSGLQVWLLRCVDRHLHCMERSLSQISDLLTEHGVDVMEDIHEFDRAPLVLEAFAAKPAEDRELAARERHSADVLPEEVPFSDTNHHDIAEFCVLLIVELFEEVSMDEVLLRTDLRHLEVDESRANRHEACEKNLEQPSDGTLLCQLTSVLHAEQLQVLLENLADCRDDRADPENRVRLQGDIDFNEISPEQQVFWWRTPVSTDAIDDEAERQRIIARRWS